MKPNRSSDLENIIKSMDVIQEIHKEVKALGPFKRRYFFKQFNEIHPILQEVYPIRGAHNQKDAMVTAYIRTDNKYKLEEKQ